MQIFNMLIQNNPIIHVIVAEGRLYFSHFQPLMETLPCEKQSPPL